MNDLRRRLDNAITRRDAAHSNKDRVQGRLDAARKSVEAIEQEIRDRKVDPDKLDATIEAVERKAEAQVAELEARIATTEKALEPFVGDDNR